MGASTPLKNRTPEVRPDDIAVCTGPGCGALMLYPEHRAPDDFLVVRATSTRCSGCSRHGGKGPDGGKTAGVIEDLEFLLAIGENAYQIGPRLGYRSLPSLYRLLARRGRRDLMERLLETVEDSKPWPP